MFAKVSNLTQRQTIEAGYSQDDAERVTSMVQTVSMPSRMLLPGISSIDQGFCMRLNRQGPVARDSASGVVTGLNEWATACERMVKALFFSDPGEREEGFLSKIAQNWAVLSEMPSFKQQVNEVTTLTKELLQIPDQPGSRVFTGLRNVILPVAAVRSIFQSLPSAYAEILKLPRVFSRFLEYTGNERSIQAQMHLRNYLYWVSTAQ
jgi:hypothetical protein